MKPVYQQLISSGWNAQTRAVPTTSTDGDTSQMPIMHESDLYNKTMADLPSICNQYNIRTGKAKKDYVENILKCSNTMNHNLNIVKAVQKSLSTTNLADPTPMHVFYRDYFNLIDLINRHWYAVEEHHYHQNWKTKVILAILHNATINAWAYATKLDYLEWPAWRTALVQKLLQ